MVASVSNGGDDSRFYIPQPTQNPSVGPAEGCDLLILFFKIKRSQPAAAPTGRAENQRIPGKKKADLPKAFNRATAPRTNKGKGRFDARRALKGLRRVTRTIGDY